MAFQISNGTIFANFGHHMKKLCPYYYSPLKRPKQEIGGPVGQVAY